MAADFVEDRLPSQTLSIWFNKAEVHNGARAGVFFELAYAMTQLKRDSRALYRGKAHLKTSREIAIPMNETLREASAHLAMGIPLKKAVKGSYEAMKS